jgi:integrase
VSALPRSTRPKRTQKEPHRYLTSEEIATLLAKATDGYRPLFTVAVWTGMRQSELLGLTWADVDLRESKIRVTAQLSRPTKDRPAQRVPIKTDEARDIDIDPELVAYLKSHKERAFGLGFAKEADYVFVTLPDGLPLHYRNVGKAFTQAAKWAKLNPEGRRKLRFHDLRRTYASILIAGGCEGPYVASQLGHSVEVLHSTYARLFNARGQAKRGLAAIAAARGQSQSSHEIGA